MTSASGVSILERDLRIALAIVVFIDAVFIVYLLLSVNGITFPFEELDRQLLLRNERSLATWYSSGLYLLTAMLAFVVARVEQLLEGASVRGSIPWWFVGCGILVLSADEIAQMHEWIGLYFTHRVGQDAFGWQDNNDALGGSSWVLVLAPILILAGVVLVLTLWSRLRQYPRSRILGLLGAGCWAGVPILEMLEGQLRRVEITHNWITIAEEPLEIIGATLLLYAFSGRIWLERPRLTPTTKPGS